MIKRVELTNFRGFERFSIDFRKMTILVGPNGSGKSTIIDALRVSAQMLRYARQRSSGSATYYGEERIAPYEFAAGQFGLEEDNLRYEFHDVETKLEVIFADGRELVVVWPAGQLRGFFFLRRPSVVRVTRPTDVRSEFPVLGAVPVLTPIERRERILDRRYVIQSMSGRLASRHFRNQLRVAMDRPADGFDNAFHAFVHLCGEWLRELVLYAPSVRDDEIDVYFREVVGALPRKSYGQAMASRYFFNCYFRSSNWAAVRR